MTDDGEFSRTASVYKTTIQLSIAIYKPIFGGFGYAVTDVDNTKSKYVVSLKTLPHNCFTLKSMVRNTV